MDAIGTIPKRRTPADTAEPAAKEAFRIEEFAVSYAISRAQAYKEIAAGRLIAKKVGSRTLIAKADADAWLRNLPHLQNGEVA